jgi:[acyl-carrier-protein] S-malonyltransferase
MTSGAAETIALFPGQGSIGAQAGSPWTNSRHWSVVAEVSELTGIDVEDLLLRMGDDEIVRTDRAQLGTFTLALVGWRDLLEREPAPHFLAGHSLGEITALVAAGVLSLSDGARLVARRGEAMRRASEAAPGSMIALMGGSEGAREALAGRENIWVANVNGADQIVVSGTVTALAQLTEDARSIGWRRATPLPVGGAFHSPLMALAQGDLDDALSECEFRECETHIGANVDGSWHRGGPEWRGLLSRQLANPVLYFPMIASLDASVTRAVEMPPAGVLAGLTKRIRPFDSIETLTTVVDP